MALPDILRALSIFPLHQRHQMNIARLQQENRNLGADERRNNTGRLFLQLEILAVSIVALLSYSLYRCSCSVISYDITKLFLRDEGGLPLLVARKATGGLAGRPPGPSGCFDVDRFVLFFFKKLRF